LLPYIRTQNNRGYFNTDGTDYATVTVIVISETTTKISGQYVTIYTNRGAAFDTGSGASKVTNANGAATFTIRSTTPGEANFYAVCMGETLYPNLLNNASMESAGTGNTYALYWTGVGAAIPPYNYTRTSTVRYEGIYSVRHESGRAGNPYQDVSIIERSSLYELSAYQYGPLRQPYLDLNNTGYDKNIYAATPNTWCYSSDIWSSTTNTTARVRFQVDGSPANLDWWDNIRFQRIPTVTFMRIVEFPIAIEAEHDDVWHLGGVSIVNPWVNGSISGVFWRFNNNNDRVLLYGRVPQVWNEFETQIFKVSFRAFGLNGGAWPIAGVAVDDANTKNISVETSAVQVFYSGTFTLGVGLHKVAIVLTNGAASDLFIDWFGIGPVKSAADSPALSREEIKVRQDDTYVIPMWEFDEAGNTEGWEGYNGASVTGVSGGSLNLTTTNTEPVLLSPRVFVDQNQNKYVSFKMKVDRGTSGKLQWVRQDIPGPLGEMSFDIEADGQFHVYNIDLSSGSNYAFWGNTWNYYLTGFMLLPTNASGASVQIDWIRISNVKQGEAEINITYFGIEEGGRAGESIPLWLKVENAGGEAAEYVAATLSLPPGLVIANGGNTFGVITLYNNTTFACTVISSTAMSSTAYVTVSGRNFLSETASCSITITAKLASDTDYPPVPETVTTPYDVGVYYFPGWKQGEHWGWDVIRPEYPQRKPLLGWYNEGEPPIADWHIKWMAEHGVKFIIYDWYMWTDYNVGLEHALNAYLDSRYRSYIKFCLLWANHFAGHTRDLILYTTQYWIDHYFNQPEHYTIDNKPVVIIFSPFQFSEDLGSYAAVASVFAEMRQMCVDAGYAGLYLIAGNGTSQSEIQAIQTMGYDACTGYNYAGSGMSPEEAVLNRSPYYKCINGHRAIWEAIQGYGYLPYIALTEPGWDNGPWAGSAALVRTNRNKADYKSMLINSKAFADSYPILGKKIVISECWNEFGEGAVVEPCVEFGFDMLDAIREVFVDTNPHTDLVPADIGQSVPQWFFSYGDGLWYSAMRRAAVRLSSAAAGDLPVTDTITFTTSRSDTVTRLTLFYPKGCVLTGASLVSVKIDAITAGTISVSTETITFIASAPDSVSAGTGCTIVISGLQNPIKTGGYEVVVTTYDSKAQPVDGFTPATFTITAAPFSPSSSWLFLSRSVSADRTAKCTITVVVTDQFRNPIPGKTVLITSSRGAGIDTITQPLSVTDASGMCTGYLVSSQPGKDTVTASVNGEMGTIQNVVFRDISFGIWDFEDTKNYTAYDYSQSHNNGIIYGNTAETIGYRGAAKYFDGNADYITVPDNDSLDPFEEITVELWYMTGVTQTDKWMFNKVPGSGNMGYRLGISSANVGWQVAGASAWSYHLYDPSPAPLNAWTHVAATYEGNTMLLYVNGVKVSSLSRPEYGIYPSSIPLYLGTWAPGNAFYTGCLDEIRFYNKALTADEILLSYQGKAKPVIFTGVESKIKITSPPRSVKQGNISDVILFEVQDNIGQKVSYFTNTVTLSVSSSTGRFSQDGSSWSSSNTSVIYANEGSGYFYFRDTSAGSPAVTVSRSGLSPDTQVESVSAASVSETLSFLRLNDAKIPANGTTVSTITIYVKDIAGSALYGRQVTVYTSRGPVIDTVTQPSLTNASGICYAAIRSSTAGQDTITARCEGVTITENILNNPSFEDGTSAPSSWALNILSGASWGWDTTTVYSGARSVRISETATAQDNYAEANWAGTTYNNRWDIDPGSSFTVSQYLRTDLASDYAGMRIVWWNGGTYAGEVNADTRTGVNPWTLLQKTVTAPSNANGLMFRCDNKGVGTAWFDAVRVKRTPTMEFLAAEKLAIITPVRATIANSASESICIQAQWGTGTKAGSYSGFCALSSSSGLGKFSVSKYAPANSWTSAITVKIISGETFVYYRDTLKGSPAIYVTSTELSGTNQPGHSVGVGPFSETRSYVVMPRTGYANGTQYTVSVYVTDYWRNPRSGESVAITTSRKGTAESGYDTVQQPATKTFDNGKCTGKIWSTLVGIDTVTAYVSGQPLKRITNTIFSDLGGGAWNFDEGTGSSAADVTGNANNGTFYNSLWEDGVIGKAARTVDGSRYVSVPDDSTLDFSKALTMEVWAKIYDGNGGQTIMRKELAYYLRRDEIAEGPDFTAFVYTTGWEPRVPSNFMPDSGTNASWYHVTATYDNDTPANQLKIYVNGVLQNQISKSGNVNITSNELFMGMSGCMDEARVYGAALTPEEIYASYTGASKPITFSLPAKLTITTPQREVKQNNPSDYITVEAQDDTGNIVAVFNESITLACSSTTGRFSLDRVSWSASNNTFIYLVNGTRDFYFKDTVINSPVITVSRSGLQFDTHVVIVTQSSVSGTLSYIRVDVNNVKIPRDGVTLCTFTISVRDMDGGTPLSGKQVTVYTARGLGIDTVTQPQLTDLNGLCTAAVVSTTAGGDTIFAVCDGVTITENIINNMSFEQGTGAYPDGWGVNANTWTWVTDVVYSGAKAMRNFSDAVTDQFVEAQWTGTPYFNRWPVHPSTVFVANQWTRSDLSSGDARIRIIWFNGGSVIGEVAAAQIWGTQPWTLLSGTLTSPANADGLMYRAHNAGLGTAWFDCIRLQRYPMVEFTAAGKLAIITQPRQVNAGSVSESIVIQAQYLGGTKDSSYNGTCTLVSSSGMGFFSTSSTGWGETSTIILDIVNGETYFYYRDTKAGSPVITVTSPDLNSCTQAQSVYPGQFSETASFIMLPREAIAVDTSVCTVTIYVMDCYRNTISGQQIIITTSRMGTPQGIYDTITQPSSVSDTFGTCTGTLVSTLSGYDTVTAYIPGYSSRRVKNNIFRDIATWVTNFDEGSGSSANSISPYGGTASVAGGAQWTPDCKFGSSIYFNGSSAYAQSADQDIYDTTPMSFEMWIKTDVVQGDKQLINRITSGDQGWRTTVSGQNVNFQMPVTSWSHSLGSSITFNYGEWSHVCGTYDGANMCLYINGSPAGQLARTGGCTNSGQQLNIACYSPGGAAFNGWIDEIRIYRDALTAVEAQQSWMGEAKPIYFVSYASKLEFITPPRTTSACVKSESIAVEAQDGSGNKTNFSEMIDIASSSSSGKFSPDGVSWSSSNNTSIMMADGSMFFYYIDTTAGNPVITVSRVELASDTQVETITLSPAVAETNSYLRTNTATIPANGAAPCSVNIVIKDIYGNGLFGKQATVYTSRGSSFDTITQPSLTDINGLCTALIVSCTQGSDTITALCDGVTITENIANNPSMENGSGDPSDWYYNTASGVFSWVADDAASGIRSIRHYCPTNADNFAYINWPGAPIWGRYPVTPNTPYIFSQYSKISSASDTMVIRLIWWNNSNYITEGYYASLGNGPAGWTKISGTTNVPAGANMVEYRAMHNGTETAWFDCVRIQRVPTIDFYGATQIAFATPARAFSAGSVSDSICIQAQFPDGTKDLSYNGACSLVSTSGLGTISDTNAGGGTWYSGAVTLNLKNGETVVFYRDIKAGSPILALSAAGLTGNTQAQSVSALGFSETVSYLVIKQRLIPADNSSACTITVTVTDYYRNPLSGQAVIITTSRKGTGLDAYDFITQPGITDPSGVCTGAVVSSYGGLDTITAYIEGNSVKRVENTVLADGLIGMWNFDDGSGDVAYDLSINNNTGTITSPSWTNGLLGPCLSVNGTTGYVSVENNATLNPGAAISVEAWVKMNANDNYAEIVRKEPCYFMRKTSIGEGNNFNFFICTGGGWEPRAASSLIPDSGPNAPWYHIVGTYDSSIGGNNNKLYIDGAVDGSSAKTGPIDSSANPLRIGGLGAIWNGVMDEVRMYSRALPLDEIKAGYERKPKPVTFTGMNLKILTPQRTAAQGAATDSITVEVQGLGGGRDVSFYDTVILSSSSPGGSFSIDNIVWADTTNIYLSSGYGVFYYKDTNIGNPVITAYRESLIADTQGETITAGGAGYFSFISPEFRIRAADTSPLVTAVAYDSGGNTDVSFSSTVSLFTSSSSGSFSVSTTPWADTSTITFLNGFGYFYYRDNAVGNPVLSAMSYELSADTQVETITIRYLRFSNTTPFTITSISTAPVFLKAVDGSGNTAVLFNDTVQLLTTSTKGYFSVSGTTWVNTSIVYLVSGGKTVYYKDKIGGNPVITVTRTDSWTWTDTQQETVTKPTVLTSKVQMNVRSGETGSMPMKFWVSDTVEYTVYISNTGTETATNNLIVDTRSFDTSVNNPVDYIYMDTSGFADTWAYTTDLVSWTTGNPASGTSNVKGLRWRIDSLGINQTKAIRFRVRVK